MSTTTPSNPCPHCHGEYELGVHDYWDDRTFTLMSCCEQGHIDAVDDLNDGVSRREFVDWFYRETGVKVRGYVMGADHYFEMLRRCFRQYLVRDGPMLQLGKPTRIPRKPVDGDHFLTIFLVFEQYVCRFSK